MHDYSQKPETVEARAILRLVSLGTTTIEGARELIAIPEREEHALRLFVAGAGKDGKPVAYALNFRHRVLDEFEKLVSAQEVPTHPHGGLVWPEVAELTQEIADIEPSFFSDLETGKSEMEIGSLGG